MILVARLLCMVFVYYCINCLLYFGFVICCWDCNSKTNYGIYVFTVCCCWDCYCLFVLLLFLKKKRIVLMYLLFVVGVVSNVFMFVLKLTCCLLFRLFVSLSNKHRLLMQKLLYLLPRPAASSHNKFGPSVVAACRSQLSRRLSKCLSVALLMLVAFPKIITASSSAVVEVCSLWN